MTTIRMIPVHCPHCNAGANRTRRGTRGHRGGTWNCGSYDTGKRTPDCYERQIQRMKGMMEWLERLAVNRFPAWLREQAADAARTVKP